MMISFFLATDKDYYFSCFVQVVDALRNMLFGEGAAGLDLTSFNAQRNRGNGNNRLSVVRHYICRYLDRKIATEGGCPGLGQTTKWSDISSDPKIRQMLQRLYAKPEEVELFAGGVFFN